LGADKIVETGGFSVTPSNDDTMRMVRDLTARVQRLEDTIEIQQLQSKYIHYLFKQRFDRIVEECFAQNLPDVSVEFSDSGVYRGLRSVRALYKSFEVTKTIPGFFILHMTVNPVIEIAEDGLSARSHWLSPGAAGSDHSASWIWGPFYVDYVKEDGHWRIAHSNLVPVFRNRYETSWAQAPDHGTVRGVLAAPPDEPATLYKPYNEAKKERDIFANHPSLPQPADGRR
jgi:SnoaL-like domain